LAYQPARKKNGQKNKTRYVGMRCSKRMVKVMREVEVYVDFIVFWGSRGKV
jgi:hypothetical protein